VTIPSPTPSRSRELRPKRRKQRRRASLSRRRPLRQGPASVFPCHFQIWEEIDGLRFKKEDAYDRWAHLVSETINIPGRDFSFPGLPNSSRVQIRPGFNNLGYKRQGFKVQGLFQLTTTSSGLKIDFFRHHFPGPKRAHECPRSISGHRDWTDIVSLVAFMPSKLAGQTW
jgi:hypothetical protein